MGLQTDAAGFLATVAGWFVRLIVLVSAFDALGLPAVSQVLQQLLLWLPNLVVAMIALVLGGLAATGLARLVRGAAAESGFGSPDFLANVARLSAWAGATQQPPSCATGTRLASGWLRSCNTQPTPCSGRHRIRPPLHVPVDKRRKGERQA
jgi:hypothetical protein